MTATARRSDRRAAFAFLSPWLIGFAVFTAWPLGYSVYLSLTDYDVINDPSFVGFDNYAQLFADPKISLALTNTFLFTIMQVPVHVIVSLMLALLLSQAAQRSAGFFRTLFFLPKMTPPVAIGILFLLLFNGQNGLINTVLGFFGIDGPSWTTDPAWVKPGLVLMSAWSVGASVIILLAALQNVPRELVESARMDGAGPVRTTFSITLPMISPALFFIIIVNTIASLQTFDEAYTAFFGAGNTTYSNDAALFYVIYLFQQAFEFLHMGYASAMAWVLFAIIMVITAVQLVVSRRLVYYEGEAK
ncbi:carbohydrate ABC transporter permease [Microbacterium alcoholitolerans]|uniref:carbohydrate ABC transporter permease n=1 Tax=unclassified Microbacterium TaxID=2609290 RepID=UPI003D171E7D